MADTPKKPRAVKIDVRCDDDVASGAYINMARIQHNQTEFVMDGLFMVPGTKQATVRSRLILSPVHAKSIYAALGHNIKMYESKFGSIEIPGKDASGEPGPSLH
jgi:hypothetical protein